MEYKNKKVLVLGKGKTGKSISEFMISKGAIVKTVDEADDGPFINIKPDEYDLVIQSPGISRQHPFLINCDESGVKVTNEIEIAYEFSDKPIIGVTGTNGKTTIVSLIDSIFKECKRKSFLVGNVGNPFIDYIEKSPDVYVLEVSSYQLETIDNFRPHIAIISNLTPDHLERHKTMENYLRIKANIFKNMSSEDFLILNYDDDNLRKLEVQNTDPYYYSLHDEVKGIYVKDDMVILNIDQPMTLFSAKELKIIGRHNIENVIAGVLAAVLFGCSSDCAVNGAINFKGVPHRLEYIRETNGVKYFNDSKATNPEAAIIGIKAFEGKNLFAILGGSEKEVSYKDLAKLIVANNVFAILQGTTKDEIADDLDEISYKRYIKLENLREAVDFATENTKAGDIVLLSPACASFDQFDNFEHRGEVFKKYVSKI